MSAETATQGALYVALSALGLTVYSDAPQAADGGEAGAFPFVTVGAIVFARWDTKGKNGFDFVARIHTRSRSGSNAEALGVMGQIYDRLHQGSLDVSGYDLTLLQYETSDVTRVSDGSFHGISEFRGLIEKA